MKILYFLTEFPAYSETFIQQEINQLLASGHRVTIVNLSGKNSRQKDKAYTIVNNSTNPFALVWAIVKRVIQLKSSTLSSFALNHVARTIFAHPRSVAKNLFLLFSLDYVLEKLEGEEADLAVLHFLFRSTLAGFLVSEKIGIPYHLRLHTKSSVISGSTIAQILNQANNITAISQDTGRYYVEQYDLQREIQVVRQSINLAELLAVESAANEVGFKIMAIGRLVEKKGFIHLIEAIGLISEEDRAGIQLEIYGNGQEKKALVEAIEKYQLKDVVTLKGVLSHSLLMEALAKADVLVVPSISTQSDVDGIPTVIPESMVLKTPVVATTVAGIPELIDDGQTGYLVQPRDAKALANKILALKDNPQMRLAVQELAFKKVIAEYKSSLANRIEKDIYN